MNTETTEETKQEVQVEAPVRISQREFKNRRKAEKIAQARQRSISHALLDVIGIPRSVNGNLLGLLRRKNILDREES